MKYELIRTNESQKHMAAVNDFLKTVNNIEVHTIRTWTTSNFTYFTEILYDTKSIHD